MHPLMTTYLRIPQVPIKFVYGAPNRNNCNSYLLVILHKNNRRISQEYTTQKFFLLRCYSSYLQNLAVNCNY
jgi:hypothetical protein